MKWRSASARTRRRLERSGLWAETLYHQTSAREVYELEMKKAAHLHRLAWQCRLNGDETSAIAVLEIRARVQAKLLCTARELPRDDHDTVRHIEVETTA
jgi:hypothetical protein